MRNQILVACLFVFASCTSSKHAVTASADSIPRLKFLDEYDIPNGTQYKGTTIGGLSGIDYDSTSGIYYIISDDRSAINPARFYTAKIHFKENGIDSVEFTDMRILRQQDGKPYPNAKQDPFHTPDPEDIRYNPVRDEIVWSSEGERKPADNILEDPAVIAVSKEGTYRDSFELPANMHIHLTDMGPRQNSVFEGLAFSPDYKYLFVSVEEPIYEDGPRAGAKDSTAWVRIIKFDAQKRKQVAQYAYRIEPVAYPASPLNSFKINGVSAILMAGENKLLAVERSFSTGRLACTVRVFLADMNGASDITGITSLQLQSPPTPVSKRLMLNMDDLGRYIDNIEGISAGPTLPNGHKSILFLADNNFSPLEKTQILLFELIP